MRKITAGLLAVLAAHDAIRRIFLFSSRSMWANAWTRKIGSLPWYVLYVAGNPNSYR